MASAVDMALAPCRSEQALMQTLMTSDLCEVNLRHLSAFVYETRTKDRAGAQRMRALTAPGIGRDVAPEWLMSEVAAYGKVEHQREERVNAAIRRRDKESTAKGGGKGDQKKGEDLNLDEAADSAADDSHAHFTAIWCC